ncbi:acyl-CoA thioesterase [Mycolicibacterium sp. XJ1819]
MTSQVHDADYNATEFTWKRTTGAPPTDEGGVVPGIDLVAMLHDAANDLVTELFGAADLKSLASLPIRPVLLGISAVFDAPLAPGTPVIVGATSESLSRRSFELRTGVWTRHDGALVAHGGATFVVVDATSQKAVPVPENIADALRSLRPALRTAAHSPDNQPSQATSPPA